MEDCKFFFNMIGGEVIEVSAECPEEAWSVFYSNMTGLNQDQATSLLRNVTYLDGDRQRLLWGS